MTRKDGENTMNGVSLKNCLTKSNGDNTVDSVTKEYTCQLSRLRRESHACGLKTSISCRLMPADQFLMPD